jgi:hypothetical protein
MKHGGSLGLLFMVGLNHEIKIGSDSVVSRNV